MIRILAISLVLTSFTFAQADSFPFQKSDHISILGNTLAERMQHSSWMETLIHSRLPNHELSFRNLGYSGDELTLRLRSSGFGSPEDWLKLTNTNVVFAFFGYNESFAGEPGLPKFEKDLDTFLKNLLDKKFDSKNNPRVVLFSPIAHHAAIHSPRGAAAVWCSTSRTATVHSCDAGATTFCTSTALLCTTVSHLLVGMNMVLVDCHHLVVFLKWSNNARRAMFCSHRLQLVMLSSLRFTRYSGIYFCVAPDLGESCRSR